MEATTTEETTMTTTNPYAVGRMVYPTETAARDAAMRTGAIYPEIEVTITERATGRTVATYLAGDEVAR